MNSLFHSLVSIKHGVCYKNSFHSKHLLHNYLRCKNLHTSESNCYGFRLVCTKNNWREKCINVQFMFLMLEYDHKHDHFHNVQASSAIRALSLSLSPFGLKHAIKFKISRLNWTRTIYATHCFCIRRWTKCLAWRWYKHRSSWCVSVSITILFLL